jgi:site-specific recombinase XerC
LTLLPSPLAGDTPGFRAGVAPRNKGQRYPADPPTVDEIVAVMRQAGHDRHGHRLTALIVVLWRARLRIHEALSLAEADLDQRRGSILVRHGKSDRRREVGMEAWAWSAIEPWLADRAGLPIGPLFCGSTAQPATGRGLTAPHASSFATSRSRHESGAGSRLTSCATRTPSSSCTRGSRYR